MEQAQDFIDESHALLYLLSSHADDDYERITQFKDWTINDVLRHLHYWNWMAGLQLADEARLSNELDLVATDGMRARERAFADGMSGNVLMNAWWQQVEQTGALFSKADPKARLKWAGPEMSARSSITARLMETWAHGQEVFDALGAQREESDRLKNIVILGVNTFGWTYAVRKQKPPGEMPYVRLTAPSGALWEFGDPASGDRVSGSASEFCQVVTQTRNVKDTSLAVSGPVAEDWMSKAQCFAGGVADPPAPGTRYRELLH
ncbi:MAG: TIGR03084 family metal-binding protein [Hyphomonas sp.]|nr:TIGR03084 family protein [Hyphomonas sp.]